MSSSEFTDRNNHKEKNERILKFSQETLELSTKLVGGKTEFINKSTLMKIMN